MNKNEPYELGKTKSHIIVEIIEYSPNLVASKPIIKKSTGNITAMIFDVGEELSEKTIPFDTYVQIIHGTALLTINKVKQQLKLGESIVIPAHSLQHFSANEYFKMISTVKKSGFEEYVYPE
jgi:quercetin dioxygenase-like cupin family protein